jgi:hypothetical protein
MHRFSAKKNPENIGRQRCYQKASEKSIYRWLVSSDFQSVDYLRKIIGLKKVEE